jgi:ubiquinone/menaquinone biosynthesis C-methylase UbiE
MLTGSRPAYRYLAASIEHFSAGVDVVDELKKAGFQQVAATPLTAGVVRVYTGRKSPF